MPGLLGIGERSAQPVPGRELLVVSTLLAGIRHGRSIGASVEQLRARVCARRSLACIDLGRAQAGASVRLTQLWRRAGPKPHPAISLAAQELHARAPKRTNFAGRLQDDSRTAVAVGAARVTSHPAPAVAIEARQDSATTLRAKREQHRAHDD